MAPSSVAIGSTWASAAVSPETTMLPGPSMLAFQSRPCGATRRQSSSTFASSRPRTLVMPLGVATAAACIAWPRRRTTRRPVSKSIAPAKTRAVYSPRLSPAAPAQAATTSGSVGLQVFQGREAGDEDGRLADVGRLQGLGRAVEAERPEVEAEDLVGAVEQGAGRGQLAVELPAHADGLGTLAGEEEGDLGHGPRPHREGRTDRSGHAEWRIRHGAGRRHRPVERLPPSVVAWPFARAGAAGALDDPVLMRSSAMVAGHAQGVLDGPGVGRAVADDARAADAQQRPAAELVVLEPRS